MLPGDLFSFYTWGGTVDPILQALTRKPVAERTEVPYADLHATDLMWTIDSLVHQQRLLPGQLAPLLNLIGVRTVVTGTDDDLARSDAPAPADATQQLASQPGFARPSRTYGPPRSFAPSSLGPRVSLPEVRTYDLASSRGIVSVQPRSNPVIVDGSASGLAELAAFAALPPTRPILYAADLDSAQMRSELADGGDVVISDSNRRQAFVVGSLEQDSGPVLTAQQSVSADGELLDPFGRGPEDETVATFGGGIRSVSAPYDPESVQFPEHGPFAAIDGSTATAWLADPTLTPDQRFIQIEFAHPTDVGSVMLMPYDDAGGSVKQVQIAGRTFDVHPGWNRLALNLHGASSLTVALTKISAPAPGVAAGAGGIRELQIPGIRATQALRLPVDAGRDLAGADLDRVSLAYLFQRLTGDDPYQRDLAHGPWSAFDVRQPGDAEQLMRREFELPAARSFRASAWVRPFSQTSDTALDRLAGYRGPVVATSSSRFDGEPQWRASRALDGNPASAWIGDYQPGQPAWLQWSDGRPMTVRVLRLVPPPIPVRRPTRVELTWPGGSSGPLTVGSGGAVALPAAVRARVFRLSVLSAASPAGATAAQRRAVGIAEIDGAPRVHSETGFRAPCGSVAFVVGGRRVAMQVGGSSSAFESGAPLPATSCGAPFALPAGAQQLAVEPGPFAVDDLRLSSPAPAPVAIAPQTAAVIDSGTSAFNHIRVSVSGPSWLVLGESYDRGWRASCSGRSLGAPVPINGYANGWRIGAWCRNASFAFAPQRLAVAGYAVSAVTAIICLLLLLAGLRRRSEQPAVAAPLTAGEAPEAWPAIRALAAAVIAGAVIGFVFGIQAGVVAIPAVWLILWRAVGVRWLVLAAGALLGIVVPILYLVHTGGEQGANHFGYAMAHLAANWAGVAALVALIAALWRTLAPVARNRPARGGRRRARSPAA